MRIRAGALVATLLALSGLAAAAQPAPEPEVVVVEAPAPAEAALAEAPAEAADGSPQTDARFFAELAFKDVASAADAARAMVILVSEGRNHGGDLEADRAYLREKGILPDGWLDRAAAADPLEKAHLAVLVCRALDIKGGLFMRLLGPTPRLALRECVYLELMVGGSEYGHVQGGELAGVIDRADRFRLKEAGREAVPELEGDPSGALKVEEPK